MEPFAAAPKVLEIANCMYALDDKKVVPLVLVRQMLIPRLMQTQRVPMLIAEIRQRAFPVWFHWTQSVFAVSVQA